jgi:outer membrane receptor protein involved in Fe transport
VIRAQLRLPAVFVLSLVLGRGVSLAQGISGIRGQVLDKDGAPIPGATISLTQPSSGAARGAITDAHGEYRIAPLPPGTGYVIRASFPGLASVSIPDVELSAGVMTVVPMTLRPESEVREKVRVQARADMVNTEDTTTSTRFSDEFIEDLPILGRNYQDVLSLAPGVTDVDGDGNPNIHGARDTDVVTLVDGVSTVDPLTGHVGQQLNLESIQEIEVKTSGASAEFSRAQGGFVSVVTKSGGNDFAGTFKFFWRGDLLDGDGAGIDDAHLHGGLSETGLRDLHFNDFMPFLSVGGPIVKDKAWYFLTLEWIQQQTPVNASTQSFVRTTEEKRAFLKLSWQVAQNHRLVLTTTVDPQRYDNLGLDSFTAQESGHTMQLGGVNLVLKDTSIFNPNVFLDSTLQHFTSSPRYIPTTSADTNGNGILYFDRNHNGFIEASERDVGEDYDADGAWDVFEDTLIRNNQLDPGEDVDHDKGLTPRGIPGISTGGCEGPTREDLNCNGILDPGEDRNHNGKLDDRPFPSPTDQEVQVLPDGTNIPLPYYYPYTSPRPIPSDRDLTLNLNTQVTTGPSSRSYDQTVGRNTLREDLTIFVPDWKGQHDLKFGAVLEHETFNQSTDLRPIRLATTTKFAPKQVGVLLPAEPHVENSADSTTGGVYVQDSWKPVPNLTVGLGLRFDREATNSFGYTPIDPVAERALYDRLWELSGGELGLADGNLGDGNGVKSDGFCGDPLLRGLDCPSDPTGNPAIQQIAQLKFIAASRLTQHHTSTTIVAASLQALFPSVSTTDPDTGETVFNRDELRALGGATFQEKEPIQITNNNLAPRLFVAWDPLADGRTKLFGNWSRYYDKLFLASVVGEEGPDTIDRYYLLDADGVNAGGAPDNRIGSALSKAPPSYTQIDRGLQTPYTDEFSMGFEREIAPEVALRLTYIDRQYREQLQDADINHHVQYTPDGRVRDDIGRLLANGQNVSDSHPDLYISNFFFNQIYQVGNINTASYKGIELQLTKRLSRRWQMDASYTYSRATGAAESFQSTLGDDPSNVQNEFGYLSYDQRHVIKLNGVTFVPGDWQIGGTMSWSSGLPYSITDRFSSIDNYQYLQVRTLYGYVNPVLDADGRNEFVQLHRNTERNASVLNINLRVQKSLVIGRTTERLFVTVDNLLNTDNLTIHSYSPNNAITSGSPQLDSERRFGRRIELGFQVNF